MNPITARIIRMCLSGVTAGIMGAGAVVLSGVSGEGHLKPGTWLIALVTGIMFLCKDVQAYLSQAPTLDKLGGIE